MVYYIIGAAISWYVMYRLLVWEDRGEYKEADRYAIGITFLFSFLWPIYLPIALIMCPLIHKTLDI